MFELKISSIEEMPSIKKEWATKVVSLFDFEDNYSRNQNYQDENHYTAWFDDLTEDAAEVIEARNERNKDSEFGMICKVPTMLDVSDLLDWTQRITPDDKVLVHCTAGISRSTAMSIGILVQHGMLPEDALKHVEKIRPVLWPNVTVIKYCDDLLDCNGEIIDLVDEYFENNSGTFYWPK